MSKIQMKTSETVAEIFDNFIMTRKAKGLSDKTVSSYRSHFKSMQNHLDVNIPIDDLSKADLEMMVASMRDSGLAANSISSYVRVLKTFFSWCNIEGITQINMPRYKSEETIKETYSDSELERLLKKPNMRKCSFAEYRTWVIIYLLQAVRYMNAVDMKSISQHIFAMQSIVNYMNQSGVSQDNMTLLTKEMNSLWLCLR